MPHIMPFPPPAPPTPAVFSASGTLSVTAVTVPTITSVVPSAGYVDDVITVNGTNFGSINQVTLGAYGPSWQLVNPTTLTFTVAAVGLPGEYYVLTISGPAGSAHFDTFLYNGSH